MLRVRPLPQQCSLREFQVCQIDRGHRLLGVVPLVAGIPRDQPASRAEFDEARIDGSTHIPLGSLRGRLGELPPDKEIVVFSRVSLSAYEASIILRAQGFQDVKVMDGGILMWPYSRAGA